MNKIKLPAHHHPVGKNNYIIDKNREFIHQNIYRELPAAHVSEIIIAPSAGKVSNPAVTPVDSPVTATATAVAAVAAATSSSVKRSYKGKGGGKKKKRKRDPDLFDQIGGGGKAKINLTTPVQTAIAQAKHLIALRRRTCGKRKSCKMRGGSSNSISQRRSSKKPKKKNARKRRKVNHKTTRSV